MWIEANGNTNFVSSDAILNEIASMTRGKFSRFLKVNSAPVPFVSNDGVNTRRSEQLFDKHTQTQSVNQKSVDVDGGLIEEYLREKNLT